jgi:hypothetical protein
MRMAPFALVAIAVVARPVAAPDSAGLAQCRAWQESQSVAAKLAAMGPPPTRIRIMGARYLDLLRAEAGLKKTNLLGVGLDNGQWTLTTDDVGVYIILPWLAHELGLPIKSAYDLLFSFLIVACFVSGTLGFLALTPARRSRLVGVAALAVVSLLAFRVGDVYILLGMLPVALVPWVLVAARHGTLLSLLIVGAISGALAGASDFVRAGSGTILLIFLTLALAFDKSVRPKIKLAGAAATAACFVIVWGAFMHLVSKRDAFLRQQTSNESLLRFRHPFWHSVYIGFGYAKNDLVPAYRDEVGVARVCSEHPSADYLSQDYERVLRNATEQLVWHHPGIIVRNLAKKTLVVALLVLVCGNIGWLAFLGRPIFWSIDPAFFLAMALNSLYGILVVPYASYLLGLISYSALFGATSVMLLSENAEARSPANEAIG